MCLHITIGYYLIFQTKVFKVNSSKLSKLVILEITVLLPLGTSYDIPFLKNSKDTQSVGQQKNNDKEKQRQNKNFENIKKKKKKKML